MSSWAYINGLVTVSPMGRTQSEKRYILETILSHLPRVSGSEHDMNTYIVQKSGHNSLQSHDEFGQFTNLFPDSKYGRNGWLETQTEYMVVVDGSLRDREYKETLKAFMNWICRLSKRCSVDDVIVKVSGYDKSSIITNENDVFSDMFERPSWANENEEPNWAEYLMWQPMKDSEYPAVLAYKYYNDKDNDSRVEKYIHCDK